MTYDFANWEAKKKMPKNRIGLQLSVRQSSMNEAFEQTKSRVSYKHCFLLKSVKQRDLGSKPVVIIIVKFVADGLINNR